MNRKLTLFFLWCIFATVARAAYVPATITSGFNQDVIANGQGSGSTPNQALLTVTSPFDIPNNYAYMSANYQVNTSTAAYTNALPITGTINSAVTSGLSFQLKNYDSLNALFLTSSTTYGMVSLNATNVAEVYLLTAAANGAVTFSATIYFSDFTSETFNGLTAKDWFNQTGYSINNLYRVNTTTGAVNVTSSNPRLYENKLTLSAASIGKTITDIDITATIGSTSTSSMGLFAVSTSTACTGTPVAATITGSTYVCAGASVTYTATNPATNTGGVTYEWQTSPGGLNSWTPVTGATNSTYTTVISAPTDIRYVATCNASFFSAPSNVLTVTLNPICYCSPTYTNNCTFGNKINTVTIDVYNDNSSSICAPTATPVVPVTINTTPSVSVITGGFVGISAALDLGQNGNLTDPGDIFYPQTYISSSPATYNFSLPLIATPGTYRLRIWCAGANAGSGTSTTFAPCDQYAYGNYRDYDLVYSWPLSLHLVSFDAREKAKGVTLNWKVAGDMEGYHFELQRSNDQLNFFSIGEIHAEKAKENYSYQDANPVTGLNYYRLKINDGAGNSNYSKLVSIDMGTKQSGISVNPNPAKNFISLNGAGTQSYTVTIINSSGSIVKKTTAVNDEKIDISMLSRGVYVIRIEGPEGSVSLKFIKE
ncbi:MAG TPA: T9SS type A sorting domain-containing protein [Flavipsychrobacter sp.]|nr:T9SS type A sorting domain-containing protein [Flavipsychrobacter sp.]